MQNSPDYTSYRQEHLEQSALWGTSQISHLVFLNLSVLLSNQLESKNKGGSVKNLLRNLRLNRSQMQLIFLL